MTIRPVRGGYDICRKQLSSVLSKKIDEGISTFPLVLKKPDMHFERIAIKSLSSLVGVWVLHSSTNLPNMGCIRVTGVDDAAAGRLQNARGSGFMVWSFSNSAGAA